MLNKVILMGRLVDNPELKKTSSGVSVVTTRIAVDRDYTDKNGDRPADFPTVIFWRATAEFVNRYFRKGSMIAVVGSVQTRSFKNKNGENRFVTEIVAESASFTGEKTDNTQNQQQQQGFYQQQTEQTPPPQQQYQQPQSAPYPSAQQPPSYSASNNTAMGEPTLFSDDDLPF